MKIENIYLSCPVSNDIGLLNQIVNDLDKVSQKYNVSLNFWKRTSYYNLEWISRCDIFVISLPNNKFRFNVKDLPIGCWKEYKKALELGKKIFVAYCLKGDNSIQYYQLSDGCQEDEIILSTSRQRLEQFLHYSKKENNSLETKGKPLDNKVIDNMQYPLMPTECINKEDMYYFLY